ncbi:unnamed protein product [Schistosoma mattheei]|uniref:Uncharacterized protein n=1 Tax=Schistosoma mattheei TaxID=31246 RepID=A0A183P378_9TREM|nr:unnamed protein product [Schistosoma mattheei]
MLREVMLPDGLDPVSPSFTVRDVGFVLLGTCRQGVPVMLREVMLPDGLDPVSPSFTVRDVTNERLGLRLRFSC